MAETGVAGKIDVTKTVDSYRAKRGEFRIVDVPARRYLMIDGHGDPNTAPAYAEALAALYPVAYKLKFASKRTLDRDYVVPPLEGLWTAADVDSFTTARDKSQWDWTMMILVPAPRTFGWRVWSLRPPEGRRLRHLSATDCGSGGATGHLSEIEATTRVT
ncbi:GyrI-like domain-containing protein [Microbacterium sp. NEAU-LLC]|uniref:GyrI-like domain-containing protein n=1 Tax=Microbacterium helvum TaxID=2773713 RepID=A0ABR8NIA6_9MICO|nr:GyrI-like domain-containing protein [Microbacterium helvum]MBD3940428.1 GyrI-like domain-containing protein [Microbacterium helvum]